MIQFDDGTIFSYVHIGEFHSQGAWIHPTRIIDTWELILVLEGTVCLREGQTDYTLHPNQAILLEPGVEHGGTRTEQTPTAFYWFHFTTDRPMPLKTYRGKDYYELKQMMKRLLHITNTPGCPTGAADAQGYLIFDELDRRARAETLSEGNRISQILEYIKINGHRNLTVTELAARFHFHPDYLGRLFRQSVGVNLKSYLDQRKLQQARDLLLTTDRTVKQIASELGFSNENLFIKFFLYHEKITPTAFRSRYYNTHLNNR